MVRAPPFSGLSDPYCILGILNRSHLEDKVVKKADLLKWKENGLVGELVQTTVREKCLNPEWDEKFEL